MEARCSLDVCGDGTKQGEHTAPPVTREVRKVGLQTMGDEDSRMEWVLSRD